MNDLFVKELLEKVRVLVEEHKEKNKQIVSFRVTMDADRNIMVLLNNVYDAGD